MSLLLAHRPDGRTLLVVGAGRLAASRARTALDAGMRPVVVWDTPWSEVHPELHACLAEDAYLRVPSALLFPTDSGACEEAWRETIKKVDGDYTLLAVCVTDTLAPEQASDHRRLERCAAVYRVCRSMRLLVNVTDQPELGNFSFPATHRFACTGEDGPRVPPLQIAVTTNGRGCRLAGRIRRTLVAALPASIGDAVERVGELREFAKQLDSVHAHTQEDDPLHGDSLGYQPSLPEERVRVQHRRMRWVAQISEYWPLDRLAKLGPAEMQELLEAQQTASDEPSDTSAPLPASQHALSLAPKPRQQGHVYLLGSGPGHPGLLTMAAHHILTSPDTDLILSDKLVPTAVLELIPASIPLVIARKFPGNAEGAQSELIARATEAAKQGKRVVRLKQGDPYVYGRGGEEFVACRQEGIACTVVPGISSAFAGPLLANIPVTQRGAAESVVMCTGVGRGGRRVSLPGYERGRTLLVLMGVARLRAVVDILTAQGNDTGRQGAAYPPHLPIAIVERASSRDQRVLASTLDRIVDVVEGVPDGQRPPSMMVVGWAVLSLAGAVAGNGVLDDEERCASAEDPAAALDRCDEDRIASWLGTHTFHRQEGLPEGYTQLDDYLRNTNPHDLGDRTETGWYPPRYAAGPSGGWTAQET